MRPFIPLLAAAASLKDKPLTFFYKEQALVLTALLEQLMILLMKHLVRLTHMAGRTNKTSVSVSHPILVLTFQLQDVSLESLSCIQSTNASVYPKQIMMNSMLLLMH